MMRMIQTDSRLKSTTINDLGKEILGGRGKCGTITGQLCLMPGVQKKKNKLIKYLQHI